jgi:N-acetylglucosaminyldiphosphoundecaprenol N-acetyl-beta-D-mannosaminyltransferase
MTTESRALENVIQYRNGHLTERVNVVPEFNVLGVRVHAIQIPEVINWMECTVMAGVWGRFLAATGMHGITEAMHDPHFRTILNEADLVVPDGMPIVWLARKQGFRLGRRVYGPELMETFCRETGAKYRHFFYGGAPGVPEQLAEVMERKHKIRIAGCWSPPYRSLTDAEEIQLKEMIVAAAPDVLWVGLSTPKQERWMHDHRDSLPIPLMMGVGAAFDFHTGRVKQAPRWMQESGLEWFFRLIQEPKRLWRRYLINGAEFIWNVAIEQLGLSKIDAYRSADKVPRLSKTPAGD